MGIFLVTDSVNFIRIYHNETILIKSMTALSCFNFNAARYDIDHFHIPVKMRFDMPVMVNLILEDILI